MLDVRQYKKIYNYYFVENSTFMDAEEMKQRTKSFAIKVALLTQRLAETTINRAYINQIIRSASSVGANYRASRRAKSNADFINKLKIV